MTAQLSVGEVRSLPIDKIEVLNPRERNSRAFSEVVANIKAIGLKKPIVVTPRPKPDGTDHYLLVCGEGRLNAFRSLGEREIPALVVTASDEDSVPIVPFVPWCCPRCGSKQVRTYGRGRGGRYRSAELRGELASPLLEPPAQPLRGEA